MRAALQFLTIVPLPAPLVPPGAAAAWYPAAGALIGLVVAACWHTPMQATLAILAAVVLTGGLHEDGLADVCDAVRAGRTRERMLEILKDSRIGTYGALAIVLSVLVRWQAMTRLTGNVWWCFVLVFAASRASMVWLAATTTPAAPGLGSAFRDSLPRSALPLGLLQVVLIPVAAADTRLWLPLAAVALSVVLVRAWLMRRLGGFTGDCLGLQCQIAEATALAVLAWQ